MKKSLIIAYKEYRSYLTGPIAYIIGSAFMLLMGLMFFAIFSEFAKRSTYAMMSGGGMSLTDYVFRPQFGNVNVVLLIVIPAFTMRLFAEEKRHRTIDLLMTSPLNSWEIVLGKFLAGIFTVWSLLALTLIFPLTVRLFTTFDKGPLLTTYLGLGLVSAVYVAIGLFASSLTENVIIAYFIAFVMELLFWVIGWAAQTVDGPTAQGVFNYLCVSTHFADFSSGMIDTSGLVYFVSLIFFFCFLTDRIVESSRWR